LVTTASGGIPASSGALGGTFVKFTMDHSIIENCSTTEVGGAAEFVQSIATIASSTIARCRAGSLGGAIGMFGGTLDLHDSNLVDNQSTNSPQGSALGTAPAPAGSGVPDMNIDGLVLNCIFSNNTGSQTFWEGDRVTTPFNRLTYGSNQIFATGFAPFFSQVTGDLGVLQLNDIVVPRSDGTQTKKAPFPNSALNAPPVTGTILMVPPTILQGGAPGETFPIPSYVAYASSGGTASVDGAAQHDSSGVIPTSTDGTHTLVIAGKSVTTPPSPPAYAANISTRLTVGMNQDVLIGGFIVQGPSPKRVLIRAIGPSLPLGGVLQDPYLEQHDGTGKIVATNDNWRTTNIGGLLTSSQVIDIIASTVPPSQNMESAIVATLASGSYTAVVRGASNDTGIAVVEAYDLDPIQTSTLANIATRGLVQTGDNVMIGGFIYLGGAGSTKVVVRGIGPSLGAAGIINPLPDPMLELHDGNGAIVASNDDWGSSPDANTIQGVGLQPSNTAEAAIYQTGLSRGPYTAILRGKNGVAGVGVVEVYVF
jgi:hypothetical protein